MIHRLLLAYRGTAYAGWQRQDNAPTVQAAVEAALAAVVGREVVVHGAGRTDAGVHARGQVAHLDAPAEIPLGALVHAVNQRLPGDIRSLAADRPGEGFHARFSALGKEYRYRVLTAPVADPIDAPFVWRLGRRLDLEALREASAALVGRHDFSALALAGGSHGSGIRRVDRAEWTANGRELTFVIVGEGFLRGLVRRLVGTLVEIGEHRRSPSDLARLLAGASGGDAVAAGPTAPAQGLMLQRVEYPAAFGGALEPW
jgi:tRNA pseudouridine38-40 synthase